MEVIMSILDDLIRAQNTLTGKVQYPNDDELIARFFPDSTHVIDNLTEYQNEIIRLSRRAYADAFDSPVHSLTKTEEV